MSNKWTLFPVYDFSPFSWRTCLLYKVNRPCIITARNHLQTSTLCLAMIMLMKYDMKKLQKYLFLFISQFITPLMMLIVSLFCPIPRCFHFHNTCFNQHIFWNNKILAHYFYSQSQPWVLVDCGPTVLTSICGSSTGGKFWWTDKLIMHKRFEVWQPGTSKILLTIAFVVTRMFLCKFVILKISLKRFEIVCKDEGRL